MKNKILFVKILNILFSSSICILLFFIIGPWKIPPIWVVLYYSFFGFLLSILPQMALEILINYFLGKYSINIVLNIILSIILGFIIATIIFFIYTIGTSLREYLFFSYYFYLPIIISGIVFRIIKNEIRKRLKE